MAFYFLILFAVYFALLVVLRLGWARGIAEKEMPTIKKTYFISVVVAVRNEAENMERLLEGLMAQNYPQLAFEVILVDDHSTDGAVEKCKGRLSNLVALCLDKNENGKKAALTFGINHASGEIIATTDADCFLPEDWLATINATFQQDQINMVAGMVAIADEDKLFSRWQAMEFASVMGTSTAAVGLNNPFMCNGANLSFRKNIFNEVGGYKGNEHIASGDDEFLMHKILHRFSGSVHLMKSVVTTRAQGAVNDFFSQRIRWASKWKANAQSAPKLLAVFVFLVQLSWLYFLVSFYRYDMIAVIIVIFLKVVADILFLLPVFRFLNIRFRLLPFLGLQFFYPFYVILVGLLAPWISYRWKDRKIV